jgi:hypothetical protein
MGGCSKHINHVYEDLSLTFDDAMLILSEIAKGPDCRIDMFEKFDGINIWAKGSRGEMRFARNKTDLKVGGMTFADVEARYADKKSIKKAFVEGTAVIIDSGIVLDDWTPIEIVHVDCPNTMHYTNSAIVFHSDAINTNDCIKGWIVTGPRKIICNRVDETILKKALDDLSVCCRIAGGMDKSFDGYIGVETWSDAYMLNIPDDFVNEAFYRAHYGEPSLTELKKNCNKSTYQTIKRFVEDYPARCKHHMKPIEAAIYAVGPAEVSRLRHEATKALHASRECDEQTKKFIAEKAERIGGIEKVSAAIEGVVFDWKGCSLKMTAAFAHINQIFGAFKYGRKGHT